MIAVGVERHLYQQPHVQDQPDSPFSACFGEDPEEEEEEEEEATCAAFDMRRFAGVGIMVTACCRYDLSCLRLLYCQCCGHGFVFKLICYDADHPEQIKCPSGFKVRRLVQFIPCLPSLRSCLLSSLPHSLLARHAAESSFGGQYKILLKTCLYAWFVMPMLQHFLW